MDTKKVFDEILLALADQFEAGNPNHWYSFESDAADYEPVREYLAALVAEGSIIRDFAGHFQFSRDGYAKYSDRVKAVRALGRSA